MVYVEVRKRGQRTRGESLQNRQARVAAEMRKGDGHAQLIAQTFGVPRVVQQSKERVLHDTRLAHHTI